MTGTWLRGRWGTLARGVLACAAVAVWLCGCGGLDLMNANKDDVPPAVAEKPGDRRELNSPMLRELRNHMQHLEGLGALKGSPGDLLKSLDDADKLLKQIKLQNRTAIANANRQVRISSPAKSPNIILIVAPRLGVGDLGAYGQTKIATPHLDSLAKAGMTFTNFYAGAPSVRGSHWTLQTGWTASRSREDFLVKEETYTLAETLWQGGYHTAFYGMWMAPDNATIHDSPLRHGFDTWAGQLHANAASFAYARTFWVNDELIELPKSEKSVSMGDLIVQSAIRELECQVPQHRPFFLMVVLPPYLQIAEDFANEKLSDDIDWPVPAQSYGAAVGMFDRDVGHLLNGLHHSGLTSRTCVFFTALSGADATQAEARKYFNSTGPYRLDESTLGEANLRVPLIGAFPALFPPGRKVAFPAAMWDLLPTFTHLTFTQTHRTGMDGISLVPLLHRDTIMPSRLLYWETLGAKAQAVRLGEWKGLRRAGSKQLELYQLLADPGETKNIAGQHPEILRKMIQPKPGDALPGEPKPAIAEKPLGPNFVPPLPPPPKK